MATTKKGEIRTTPRSKYETCGDPITTELGLKDMVERYLDEPEWTFDVETYGRREKRYDKDKPGLDPLTNEVFWISFSGPGRCDVLPIGHPQEHGGPIDQLDRSVAFKILEPLFFNDARKIGHNVKFDVMSTAKYYDGTAMPGPYGDTAIAQHVLNENLGPKGYNLEALVGRHFGFNYEKIAKRGDIETFPYLDVSRYSYLDSKFAWLLWRKFKKLINEHRLAGVFKLEMAVLEVVIAMEMTGAPCDVSVLEALDKDLTKRKTEIEYRLWEANDNAPFNLNAPAAKGKFVYKVRGHKPRHFTEKTGAPSTAANHLELYASKDPRVHDMVEWGKLDKLHGTYVKGLVPKIVPETGRLHTDFRQTGTVTGRFSSASPNLQNIPSRSDDGKEVRKAFVAPPGFLLIVADYSQIELRMLAHFSQDENLIAGYVAGLDLHTLTASKAYHVSPEDVTPLQRSLGKNVNFSVCFGVTPKTLVEKYKVPSEKEGQALIDGFYAAYPKVQPWMDRILRDARSARPPHVTTLMGRKRRLGALMSTRYGERMGAERQAINTVIQGSAADLNKLAMVRLHAMALPEQKLILSVHDELVSIVPKKLADEAAAIQREAMEGAYQLKGLSLAADVKVVECWADAK